MKKILFVCICCFALQLNGQDKSMADKAATQQVSKKVAELFNLNKVSDAVKELTPYWPIASNEIDEFETKTIKYLNLYNETYGKSIGILKIRDESIGDVGIRETYLVRFKVTALRLKFTYYKNEQGWIVNSFKWDDSFTEEFK